MHAEIKGQPEFVVTMSREEAVRIVALALRVSVGSELGILHPLSRLDPSLINEAKRTYVVRAESDIEGEPVVIIDTI